MSKQFGRADRQPSTAETGFEALQSATEFRGPVESLDGHEDNDHFALIYESQAEQFATVVPFVQQGLERGERCVYIVDDNSRDELVAELRDGGVDVDAALDTGQLSIHSIEETYLKGGEFDVGEARDLLQRAMAEALDEYEGFRVTAEETWLVDDVAAQTEFMTCEAHVNNLIEGEAGMALCQYNRTELPPEVIDDVINTHPYLIYDDTACPNDYYTPPEEYFGPDNPARQNERKLETLVDRTDARASLRTREWYERELYEITADPDRSFEEKLHALFDLGCEWFDLDFGFLNRVDPDADHLEIEYASNDHEYYQPGIELPLSETYCQAAADIEEAADVSNPAEEGYDDCLVYEEFGVEGYLGTYIPVDGGTDRTLAFVPAESQSVSVAEEDRTYLELLGQWIGYELERRQRERELRERTEHLRALVETTPECIKTVAEDGTLLQMNPAGLDMVEADSASAVTGESVYDLIAPEHRERFREFNERVCRGERGTLEFDIIGLEGTRRHMESHAAPLYRPDGTTAHVALTRDVTEQKERERELDETITELQESEERLQLALEAGEMGTWELDLQSGDAPVHSPQHDQVFGYEEPLDEWSFETFLDHVHPDDRERVEQCFEDAFETGKWDFECRITGADGEQRAISGQGEFHHDGDGEPVRAVGVVQDATERKEREAELRQTKSRFETVFEQSDDAIFVLDPNADELVDANPAAAQMAGYTQDELLSLSPSDLHPDEMEQFRAFLDEVYETGSAWSEDLHCRHRDGRDVPAEITASTITLDGRSLVLANVRPIEDRKKHERYQRDLYEIIADHTAPADEKFDRLLALGCERLDLPIGMVTRKCGDAFEIEQIHGTHPDIDEGTVTPPLTDSYCNQVVETGEPVSVADAGSAGWDEDALYHEFGLECYAGVELTVGGDAYGTICFTDLSPRDTEFTEAEQTFLDLMGQCVSYELERNHREDQLQQTNDRLESFASMLAHELRNPVTIGQIYSQQLPAETDAEAVDYVTEAFDRIEDMIDVMLVLTRGRDAVGERTPVDLAATAREAWDDVDAPEAGLDVAVERTIPADGTYVRHLFRNLLENAVEHGGSGVTVTVGDLADGDGFYVADDGTGIPPDDRETIFDEGYTTASDNGGTGLGLAFVQKLAEVYEWDYTVTESDAGGAQFEFRNTS